MKRNEKIFLGILIGITIVLLIFSIVRNTNNNKKAEDNQIVQEQESTDKFYATLNDGTAVNVSGKIKENKTFEGFEISNVVLIEKDNVTQLSGTITNKTDKKTEFQILNFKIVDKSRNEIVTVPCAVEELAAGEAKNIFSSSSFNYVNAYDFVISK